MDLNLIKQRLESLNKQETANSFSSLGGGIFVETEIKESDSVLLSVGSNIAVKKPKKEAIELVKKQSVQLSKIKEQLESEMNKLNSHLMSLK